MNSPVFIGVDLSDLLNKCNRNLAYWVSGKYLTDAAGNMKFVITDIHVEGGRKKVVIGL